MEISRMSEEKFDIWYSGIDAKFPTVDMFQAGTPMKAVEGRDGKRK